jgi:peptidoglycan/xylan/chitin deacetylase (PgdA/CDA1 family)
VVFSFDDGPNNNEDTTARLLDVLKARGVKASFALLGVNVEPAQDIVRRIRDEGHLIINHGYSERWAVYLTDDDFKENLVRGERAIAAALAEKTPAEPRALFYRPQGGFYSARQKQIWEASGYVLAPTTIRVHDAVRGAASKEEIISRVLKKVELHGGGIILLHDGHDSFSRMKTHLDKNPCLVYNSAYNRSFIPELVDELIAALREKEYVLNGFDLVTASTPRKR